jgi:hypothetical protein
MSSQISSVRKKHRLNRDPVQLACIQLNEMTTGMTVERKMTVRLNCID